MIVRLVVVGALLSAAVAQGQEAPPLPGKTSGSCLFPLPQIKRADGSIDPTFTGPAECLDWLGEKYTLEVVTSACKKGTPAATACPTNNVLISCIQETKHGKIVARKYAAPNAAADQYARVYNEKMLQKGCAAPWSVFGSAPATVTVAAPGVPALPGPSKGSCTYNMPGSLNLSGPQNCVDFLGDLTPAGVKSHCEGTVSPNACSTGNVILTCVRGSGIGTVVERWYGAANPESNATARTYNEELLKKGCMAPWKRLE